MVFFWSRGRYVSRAAKAIVPVETQAHFQIGKVVPARLWAAAAMFLCIALSLHIFLSLGTIYISICHQRVEAIPKIHRDVSSGQE